MSKYLIIYIIGILIIFSSSILGYCLYSNSKNIKRLTKKKSFWVEIICVSLLFVFVFSTIKNLTVLSHHSYVDYAVFLEIFNNFAHGKGLFCSMQESFISGTGNWLSAHFTPIAYFFGFLFKIWPFFQSINWSQTTLLAISSLILYGFARRNIGPFSAMCLSLALILNPSFQYITLYEFEFLRFIIPIGILTIGLILTGASPVLIFLACCASLLIREDVAFLVIGMGIFIFAFQKKKTLGMSIIFLSAIYLLIVLNIVMPFFRGSGENTHIASQWFMEFGNTPVEIIVNILKHPIKFLLFIFHPNKSVNYIMYLLPFSFVPIFGYKVLTMALFSLGLLAISSAYSHSSYFFYYISPILVVVVWATCEGIKNITNLINESSRLKGFIKLKNKISIERISFAVLMGSLASSLYFGPSPLSLQFWVKDFKVAPFRTHTFHNSRYQPSDHDDVIRKIADLIPNGASVSAEQFLLSDVYRCKSIYVFPYIDEADYIFIDKENLLKTGIANVPGSWDGLRQNPQFYYDWVEKRPDVFELVHSEDGIFLYKRRPDAPLYPQPTEIPPKN